MREASEHTSVPVNERGGVHDVGGVNQDEIGYRKRGERRRVLLLARQIA